MTPLATLQKYGLKTGVKSVKERLEASLHLNNKQDHYGFAVASLTEQELSTKNPLGDVEERAEHLSLQFLSADLALLCELAERTELIATIRECISLLSVSGENTKAIVAEKSRGIVE